MRNIHVLLIEDFVWDNLRISKQHKYSYLSEVMINRVYNQIELQIASVTLRIIDFVRYRIM